MATMKTRKLTTAQTRAIELQRIELVIGCENGDLAYQKGVGLKYDFAPAWLESDLQAKHGWDAEFRTVVSWGGGYMSAPEERITDDNGAVWTLVGSYAHGAERECPVPENHPGKVTRKECVLVSDPYRHSKGYGPKNEGAVRAECPMCEARIGKEHGYIHIGEGAESVYLKAKYERETHTMKTETKIQALVKFLDLGSDDIQATRYDPDIFDVDGAEYLVLDDLEADARARAAIGDSLYAFNTSFIAAHSDVLQTDGAKRAFAKMTDDLCEDANAFVKGVIRDYEHFLDDALKADGRAHFLNTYDGEEHEVSLETGLTLYVYRVN